jgi:isopentenyldiphosphate isomerase
MPEGLRRAAPEYAQEEFLRCVDASGRATPLPVSVLQDYDALAERHPAYALWFQTGEEPDGNRLFLIARWLCHLVGFRHRTVHLLLDHPLLADHVLVQVRGINKVEAPGCFDMPVAGHVTSLSTVEAALIRECEEELALTQDLIVDLRWVGAYDGAHLEALPGFWNVEQHTVYRGRLVEEAWLRLQPPDDEVAGIAVFPVARLCDTIARFPDRVASGLRDSGSFLCTGDASVGADEPGERE